MKKETIVELIGLALENKAEISGKEMTCGEIRIVILQRGWVFVGRYFQEGNDCHLEDASCIRAWGTTKGLGELANEGPTSNTKLDSCPTVEFHRLTVVATLKCNQSIWNKKLS